MTASASPGKSPLAKLATTALGIALLINDRRKQSGKKLIEATQKASADLIERGTEVDQQLKASANQTLDRTQSKLEQQLESGKSAVKEVQTALEQATDHGRDRILALSGVATHKDVKDNAKLSHLNALSNQMAVFNDHVNFQFNKQLNELAQKADKFDLAPLARSVELKQLAKTEELASLATSKELDALASKTDISALSEVLANIPVLTEKVETLATRDDLAPLAKEHSLKTAQAVLANQMETHHSRIEILMAQLATRDDLRDLSKRQLTKHDIDSATSLLASKEDVESVVKQLIKHIHHLERQVVYLKQQLPEPTTAAKPETAKQPREHSASSEDSQVSESINSVQVRAH
ncbi:hypothetical protein ACFOEK_13605 [Litoribrevibacter euphylliae]|uniref:Uncharacterized protein n=1 Tax=Litoribrevibacter euphylliae TaxID=1834034 RepID=A0ABV7HDV4_9GAMM